MTPPKSRTSRIESHFSSLCLIFLGQSRPLVDEGGSAGAGRGRYDLPGSRRIRDEALYLGDDLPPLGDDHARADLEVHASNQVRVDEVGALDRRACELNRIDDADGRIERT
jgi:hypothetical protein